MANKSPFNHKHFAKSTRWRLICKQNYYIFLQITQIAILQNLQISAFKLYHSYLSYTWWLYVRRTSLPTYSSSTSNYKKNQFLKKYFLDNKYYHPLPQYITIISNQILALTAKILTKYFPKSVAYFNFLV